MRYVASTNSRDPTKRRAGLGARGGLRDTAGQSLVELALLLPIFVVLLLGAAKFGILLYDSIEVSEAARAGVAYGSQSAATAGNTALMQSAATNDGPNVPGLAATAKQFWSCSKAPATQYSSAAAAAAACPNGYHVLNYVQVNTTATISSPIHILGL